MDLREALPNTAAADAPPAVLLPYQQAWVADDSPFKVMEKGRRTGVTWAEAADDVLIAAADKAAGGQNVYYIGTDKEMTEEFIDACAMWAKAYNYAAGSIEQGIWDDDGDRDIQTFTIRFPKSGHKITALASRPRKLRGRQGVLVGDEAAFQDNLEELTKAAMAFLIWGGKVRLISTHDGEENQFNQLVKDIRAGRQKGTLHRISFRDAVDQGLYQRVCLRMGKPWSAREEKQWVDGIYHYYRANAAEELDCIPSQGGGAYLTRTLIERCMDDDAPILTWSVPPEFTYEPEAYREAECADWLKEKVQPWIDALPRCRHYFGSDFARSGDASVIVPGSETSRLDLRVPFIIEMRHVPFAQQRQVLRYVIDQLPMFAAGAMDATGNGAELAEFAAQTYGPTKVEEVKLSLEWYRQHTPKLKAALEDETLSLPRHDNVLSDLRAIVQKDGVAQVPKGVKVEGTDGLMRHGDIAVALMLLVYATHEIEPEIFEYHRVPLRGGKGVDAPQRQVQITAGFKRRRGVL